MWQEMYLHRYGRNPVQCSALSYMMCVHLHCGTLLITSNINNNFSLMQSTLQHLLNFIILTSRSVSFTKEVDWNSIFMFGQVLRICCRIQNTLPSTQHVSRFPYFHHLQLFFLHGSSYLCYIELHVKLHLMANLSLLLHKMVISLRKMKLSNKERFYSVWFRFPNLGFQTQFKIIK